MSTLFVSSMTHPTWPSLPTQYKMILVYDTVSLFAIWSLFDIVKQYLIISASNVNMSRLHKWQIGSSKAISYSTRSRRVIFHYKRFFINLRPRIFQQWCKFVRHIKRSPLKRFYHYLGANIHCQYRDKCVRVKQQHPRHQPIYFLLVKLEWLDYLTCIHKRLLYLYHHGSASHTHRQRFLANESQRTD